MALKIRLWQQGCTNNTSYRIVVADSRSPRDGKCVEVIGWYTPQSGAGKPQWSIEADRLRHWLSVGAQMTQTVAAIAKKTAGEVVREWVAARESRKVQRAAKKRAA